VVQTLTSNVDLTLPLCDYLCSPNLGKFAVPCIKGLGKLGLVLKLVPDILGNYETSMKCGTLDTQIRH
jgi:hypothetical protein